MTDLKPYCQHVYEREEGMNDNDNDKKLLTEFLGECWHDNYKSRPQDLGKTLKFLYCEKCGSRNQNRTFATWQDLGGLKCKLVETGKWKDFLHFCFNSSNKDEPMSMFSDGDTDGEDRFYDEDFISWLLNPAVFIPLMLEFLRREEV